jgi:Rha family phage regulatory protein
MTSMIIMHGSNATTTSLRVAEKFGKRHDDVLKAIRVLLAEMPPEGLRNFAEIFVEDSYGRKQPAYEMSRDGFSLLAMGFTGKKALQWKLKFLEGFNLMEQALLRQQNLSWQETRSTGKQTRRMFTDTIAEFVEYVRTQDSQHSDQYFRHYTRMIYHTMGIDQPTVSRGTVRDFLDLFELNMINGAELICMGVIRAGMAAGTYYKAIFQTAKTAVIGFASTVHPARQIAMVKGVQS